jgi:hypothetical protein
VQGHRRQSPAGLPLEALSSLAPEGRLASVCGHLLLLVGSQLPALPGGPHLAPGARRPQECLGWVDARGPAEPRPHTGPLQFLPLARKKGRSVLGWPWGGPGCQPGQRSTERGPFSSPQGGYAVESRCKTQNTGPSLSLMLTQVRKDSLVTGWTC